MTPIRLCHFITGSEIGGAETILLDLLRHLPDQYDLTVVCLTGEGPLLGRLEKLGIRSVSVRMTSKADLPALGRLTSLLEGIRPQILHTHLFHASLIGTVVGRMLRTPLILSTEHSAHVQGSRASLARLRTRFSDCSVAVSSAVQEALVRAGVSPEKVRVINNGLDLEPFRAYQHPQRLREELSLPLAAPVIGMVAGFRPMKGHQHLVHAFACLASEFPTAYLVLIGDGPRRREIEALARELGLQQRVRFTGFRSDIAAILPALSIFVLSSAWEGMPISILEAMAAGLPVVASDVSGVSEVVVNESTGLLVPPGDPLPLAAALRRLLRDPSLANRMGVAGRVRIAASFDIRSTAVAYHQLYRGLLQ